MRKPLQSIPKLLESAVRATTVVASRKPSGESIAQAAQPQSPPLVTSRFRVLSELGQGGMGIVYRATDAELGYDVALKSLHSLDPDDLYHLKLEFRALTGIRHPNLVEFYELFAGPDTCYFTMEYVAGSDFVSYVRAHASSDWALFRRLALQLAQAITAVHAAQKLHRDIKPSNVLVTRTGRVVLLDFGLAQPLVVRPTQHPSVSGTLGYMPPEQLRGEAISTPADWFAFGVTLYEAIIGQRPVANPRQQIANVRLKDLRPDVPPALDSLIGQLLHRDPWQRPSANQIVDQLSEHARPSSNSDTLALDDTLQRRFINRDAELLALERELERVASGELRVVELHGQSGVGKTELARHFIESAASSDKNLTLRARCHPRENLLFNALDGALDDLSSAVDGLPQRELEQLLPQDMAAATRVFPVLARIQTTPAPAPSLSDRDTNLLPRAARAIRELLQRLGRKQTIIIWLDDVHWGDVDSAALLCAMLSEPAPPPWLLLLTYRTENRGTAPVLERLHAELNRARVTEVALTPFSTDHSVEMLRSLLPEPRTDVRAALERAAETAGGSPFFLREMAHHLARTSTQPSAANLSSVADIIRSRLDELTPDARRVLEVLAVAGAPLPLHTALGAAAVTGPARPLFAELEHSSLGRCTTLASERLVEAYHHQTRDCVLSLLPAETRKAYHRSIADTLLAEPQPNLSRVIDHYEAAEAADDVRRYIVAAARQAEQLLALDRAAFLYRRALELEHRELDRSELLMRLAAVLSEAGRDRDAADTYELAANEITLSYGPTHELTLRSLSRAADSYLKSGGRGEATRVIEQALTRAGIDVPANARAALLQTLINRLRSMLRGVTFEARAERDIETAALERLDLLRALHRHLMMVNHAAGMAIGGQLLREALAVGETRRVLHALAADISGWCVHPSSFAVRQTDRLMAEFLRLAHETKQVDIIEGYYHLRGVVRRFRGQIWEAYEDLERAMSFCNQLELRFRSETSAVQAFRLPMLAQVGELAKLRVELATAHVDALDRRDRYLEIVCVTGRPALALLADDQPAEVYARAQEVLERAPSGYSTDHFQVLLACTQADLYEGDAERAWQRLRRDWPHLKSTHILALGGIRDEMLAMRARCVLGCAEQSRGHLRRSYLRQARQDAKQILRFAQPSARGVAALIEATAARIEGNDKVAVRELALASAELRALKLSLEANAADWARAQLTGDARLREDTQQWLSTQGIVNPTALFRIAAIGCFPSR